MENVFDLNKYTCQEPAMYHLESMEKQIPLADLMPYYERPDFAVKCKDCANYNMLWSCPPYDFTPEDILENYKCAIIVCQKISFLPQAFEEYNTPEATLAYLKSIQSYRKLQIDNKVLEMERNYPASKAFLCGSCHHCAHCSRAFGLPCRAKYYQRPSMEALGYNVGSIVKHFFGFPLLWFDKKLPRYLTFVAALLLKENC